MEVIFLPDAEADLEEIADYIAQDNPARAASFILELRAACVSLGYMPEGFPLVARLSAQGVRHRTHSSYQIFYKIAGRPVSRIDILRILHGAHHIEALLE